MPACNSFFLLLHQDGVISVKDIDLVMSEGLGMRYAFIGPMETMHLNAPEGKVPSLDFLLRRSTPNTPLEAVVLSNFLLISVTER